MTLRIHNGSFLLSQNVSKKVKVGRLMWPQSTDHKKLKTKIQAANVTAMFQNCSLSISALQHRVLEIKTAQKVRGL